MAQEVLDEVPVRNVVLWTALIAGFAQHGCAKEALLCFRCMLDEGLLPDAATFTCVLNACGTLQAVSEGQIVHADAIKQGLLEENVVVANSLIDMYAKCGLLQKVGQVFAELPIQNVVTWNTLLTAYVQNGCYNKALECYEQMQLMDVSPDDVTYMCVLKSCGSLGNISKGQELDGRILRDGFSDMDMILGTALVDMYASCGMLEEAQRVFKRLLNHDVAVWNVLLAGYSLLGKHQVVFDLLNNMLREGIKPSSITYNIVLNTCSYEGLLPASQQYFKRMTRKEHGVVLTIEHYTCLLDLFCRAGHLDEAMVLVKEMPFCADLTAWQTVLDACQKWGNSTLGMLAFKQATFLDDRDPVAYVCVSNM